MNLNGTEEDRKLFKEKIYAEREESHEQTDNNSDIFSDHTSITNLTKKEKKPTLDDKVSNDSGDDEQAGDEPDGESFFVFNPNDDPTVKKK